MNLCHTKMVLSSKFDEIDTDMGSCFPIQVIVLVGFSSSDGTQIGSKSKIATFLNKPCFFFEMFCFVKKHIASWVSGSS